MIAGTSLRDALLRRPPPSFCLEDGAWVPIVLAAEVSPMQALELRRVRDDVVERLQAVARLLDGARAAWVEGLWLAFQQGCRPARRCPPSGWLSVDTSVSRDDAEGLREAALGAAAALDRFPFVGGVGKADSKRFVEIAVAMRQLAGTIEDLLDAIPSSDWR